MKSKVSNAIADLVNKFDRESPHIREKLHEFNVRYYRPQENDDIYELYNDIKDFQSSVEQIFEDEFGVSKPKSKHYTMSVTSRIPSMKIKVKDFSF